MANPKISPLVENALATIESKEWEQKELQNWFNNASKHPDLSDYERELLVDKVGAKIRFTFPLLAKKVFGAKDGKAVELLTEVVEQIKQIYDLSANELGNHVKCGGDQMGGKVYVYRYINYKSDDGWNVGLAYIQEKPDTEPFLKVSRYFKGLISNPDSHEEEIFAVDDLELAVELHRENLEGYCNPDHYQAGWDVNYIVTQHLKGHEMEFSGGLFVPGLPNSEQDAIDHLNEIWEDDRDDLIDQTDFWDKVELKAAVVDTSADWSVRIFNTRFVKEGEDSDYR